MNENIGIEEKVLRGAWRWSFYVASLIARLPLSVVSILLILGVLDEGRSVASVGALLSAIAIGAALTGIIQGPLWDRFSQVRLLFFLSFASAGFLLALAFINEGWLGILLGFIYGVARPHISTVTRSAWMHEFKTSSDLSARSVSLDISSTPVLNVIGPLLAGGLFAFLGLKMGLLAIALVALVASLALAFLLWQRSFVQDRSFAGIFKPLASAFSSGPVQTMLLLAFFSAAASGVITVLLSAHLDQAGDLDWFSWMMAVNALAIILGAWFFKRFAHAPGSYLHLFFLFEAIGLFLYAGGFLLDVIYLWPIVFLAALATAPLATTLYIIIEARSSDGARATSFSLLASAQFAGLSLGQLLFSQLAEDIGTSSTMFIAAALQFICFLAWISLPYGMRRYRLQKAIAWWPEDLEKRIAKIAAEKDSWQRGGEYASVLDYLESELERGSVPDLPRAVRENNKRNSENEEIRDAGDLVLYKLSRDAWHMAFSYEKPDFSKIRAAALWYERNSLPEEEALLASGILGFENRGFVDDTKDVIESIGDATLEDCEKRFLFLFHAAKLRANRQYQSLALWCQVFPDLEGEWMRLYRLFVSYLTDSDLSEGPLSDKDGGESENLFKEEEGNEREKEREKEREREKEFDSLWASDYLGRDDLCTPLLDILNLTLDAGNADKLLHLSDEYLRTTQKNRHLVYYFRARSLRFLGRFAEAREEVMKAYENLPRYDVTDNNAFFVEQFDLERNLIELEKGLSGE